MIGMQTGPDNGTISSTYTKTEATEAISSINIGLDSLSKAIAVITRLSKTAFVSTVLDSAKKWHSELKILL